MKTNDFDNVYLKGLDYLQEGNFEQAKSQFGTLKNSSDPDNLNPHVQRIGSLFYQLAHLEQTIFNRSKSATKITNVADARTYFVALEDVRKRAESYSEMGDKKSADFRQHHDIATKALIDSINIRPSEDLTALLNKYIF